MVRRLAVVAVLAVALAGCGAFSAGEPAATPTETVTPIAVPTDTDAERLSPPPGIAPNGSVAPGALVRAHYAALDDRSFSWHLEYRRSVDESAPAGGQTATNATVDTAERRLRVAANGSYHLVRRMTGMTGGAVYADDTGKYVRNSLESGPGYRSDVGELDYRHHLRVGQTLGRFFSVDASTVSTVERAGRTYYRVHVTDPPRTLAEGHAKQTITDYSATAYVTGDGLVRTLAVEYAYTLGDDQVTVSLRSEYRDVGATTLDRPDWVAGLVDGDRGDGTATPDPGAATARPTAEPSTGTPTATAGGDDQ